MELTSSYQSKHGLHSVPPSEEEIIRSSVYEVCDDRIRNGVILNPHVLSSTTDHQLIIDESGRTVILDRDSNSYLHVFDDPGFVVSPDDVLSSLNPLALKLPLKLRQDFQGTQLPDLDLLRAISYMGSHKDIAAGSMDETALLAMGMMVEYWADQMLEKVVGGEGPQRLAHLQNLHMSSDEDNSDTSVSSLELIEIEDGGGATKRKLSRLAENGSPVKLRNLDSSPQLQSTTEQENLSLKVPDLRHPDSSPRKTVIFSEMDDLDFQSSQIIGIRGASIVHRNDADLNCEGDTEEVSAGTIASSPTSSRNVNDIQVQASSPIREPENGNLIRPSCYEVQNEIANAKSGWTLQEEAIDLGLEFESASSVIHTPKERISIVKDISGGKSHRLESANAVKNSVANSQSSREDPSGSEECSTHFDTDAKSEKLPREALTHSSDAEDSSLAYNDAYITKNKDGNVKRVLDSRSESDLDTQEIEKEKYSLKNRNADSSENESGTNENNTVASLELDSPSISDTDYVDARPTFETPSESQIDATKPLEDKEIKGKLYPDPDHMEIVTNEPSNDIGTSELSSSSALRDESGAGSNPPLWELSPSSPQNDDYKAFEDQIMSQLAEESQMIQGSLDVAPDTNYAAFTSDSSGDESS